MKRIGYIGAVALLLLPAAIRPAHAQQQEHRGEPGNRSQQGGADRDRPDNSRPRQDGKSTPAPPDRSHPQPGGKGTPNRPDRSRPQQGDRATPDRPDRSRPQQGGNSSPSQPGRSRPQQGGRATPDQPDRSRPQPGGRSTSDQPGRSRQQGAAAIPGQPGRSSGQHVQLPSTPERQHKWQERQQGNWKQHRAHSFASEHKTWGQRGGYHGYRIPDRYFTSHFGRNHWFHVYDLPFRVVGGSPCFQYGGYWFVLVDPYPEYWGDTWYQNDDVYVDYRNDGYYLCDRRFPDRPGVAVSINISL